MLLGGLWHGANWTFMVWGGLHGWALAVTRAVGEVSSQRAKWIAAAVPAVAAGPLLGGVMTVLLGGWDAAIALRFAVLGWLLGIALALGALHRAWEGAVVATPNAGLARASGSQPPRPSRGWLGWLFTWTAVLATFHVVCAGWIYFRSRTFQDAAAFFSQLATLTTYHPNLHWLALAVLAVGMLTHWMPKRLYLGLRQAFVQAPFFVQGVVLLAAALVLREMASAEAVPFVYFQF